MILGHTRMTEPIKTIMNKSLDFAGYKRITYFHVNETQTQSILTIEVEVNMEPNCSAPNFGQFGSFSLKISPCSMSPFHVTSILVTKLWVADVGHL